VHNKNNIGTFFFIQMLLKKNQWFQAFISYSNQVKISFKCTHKFSLKIMAGFWELILVFNEITSLWWAKNFRFEKKRMWSWWGLNYFCHKKQLSATFWSGGLTFIWGTQILRIKSCLCNNLCKHYLIEFLYAQFHYNSWTQHSFIGISLYCT
jgi:hypothetical protein